MIIKKYNLYSNKVKKDIRLMLISDIHINKYIKESKFEEIYKIIDLEHPDYLCISGDLIDGLHVWDDKKINDKTSLFLKKLGQRVKVILTLGNHDISRLTKKNGCYKWKFDQNPDFINSLKKIRNVYFLDSTNRIFTDINFIGITLSPRYYMSEDSNCQPFIDDLQKSNIKIYQDKYNVMLCHSPLQLFAEEVANHVTFYHDIDLILSGHMHNGMVPPLLDKLWKSNRGLITPGKKIFTKDKTRGLVKLPTQSVIISGGITKLSAASTSFLRHFSFLYPSQIEIINILKKD